MSMRLVRCPGAACGGSCPFKMVPPLRSRGGQDTTMMREWNAGWGQPMLDVLQTVSVI